MGSTGRPKGLAKKVRTFEARPDGHRGVGWLRPTKGTARLPPDVFLTKEAAMTVTQQFYDDRRGQWVDLVYKVDQGIYELQPTESSLMDLVSKEVMKEAVH